MQCKHAHEIFSDYVAGQLDRALAVTLENHINDCASCREDVAGLRRVWTDLAELTIVDTPPFFHENLMHRINTEMATRATSAAGRRSLWDLRGLFQPRALAAAAVILIALLGSIGYVETQPAALGPFGFFFGRTQQKSATLQQPRLDWVTDTEGAKTLRVQFQLDRAAAEAGTEYTIAIGNGVGPAKNILTQTIPANGKVEARISAREAEDASNNVVLITIQSPQDNAKPLAAWHGTLPPR